MATLNGFVGSHHAAKDGLRLGQRFVNLYVRGQWTSLFYESDDRLALETIKQYLVDLQYGDSMPPPLFQHAENPGVWQDGPEPPLL